MLPFLNIFGAIIPTFGLSIIIAIVLACTLSYKSIRRDSRISKEAAPPEALLAIAAICLLFFMLGGKLLYVLVTYDLDYIFHNIKHLNFDFMATSGMVFYGGLIFGIIGAFLAARFFGMDTLIPERHVVPYLPLGHAIGRIGCFLAGCCYGMEYSGIGAVYYKNSILGLSPQTGYFPVQLLESLLNIIIMIILLRYVRKERPKGNILFAYLLMYAIMRFITELLRGDSHRGLLLGISTSQWISIALVLLFFARLILKKKIEKG